MGVTEIIAVIGTVQGLFICLIFFFLKNGRKPANILFALLVLSISFSISRPVTGEYYDLFVLFMFLFGPLFYLYVTTLTRPGLRLVPKQLLHALPFLAAVAIYLIRRIIGNPDFESWVYNPMYLLKNIHPFIYSVYLIFYLRSYRRSLKDRYSSIERISLSWVSNILLLFIIYFLIISPLMLVFYLLGFSAIIGLDAAWTPVLISIYIFFLGFNGIRYHEVFVSSPATGKGRDADYSEESAEKLEDFMQSGRPYLSDALTLEELARQSGIPDYRISRIINKKYGMNFFDYVNSFRIDYFNSLCLGSENMDRSILELALESGFYSKSTFNLSYKKKMGMTPSQYIRQKA